MRLIGNSDLANPNVCTICEESPYGATVVDTERYTPFNPTFPLNGKKYVCEKCAGEISKLIGFVSVDESAAAVFNLQNARAELANVRGRVIELAEHIKDFVNTPAALDVVASAVAVQAVVEQADSPAKAAAEAPAPSYEEVFGAADVAPVEPVKKAKGSKSSVGSASEAEKA